MLPWVLVRGSRWNVGTLGGYSSKSSLLPYYNIQFNEVERGGTLVSSYQLICPSVDGIMATLYLPQYLLDPFHICTTLDCVYHGNCFSKFQNFEILAIFYSCNFNFVLFWLGMKGIQYESIECVIMGWWVDFQNAGILIVFFNCLCIRTYPLEIQAMFVALPFYHHYCVISGDLRLVYHIYYVHYIFFRFFCSPEPLVQYSICLELSLVSIHQMQRTDTEWHLMRRLGNVAVSMINLLYKVFHTYPTCLLFSEQLIYEFWSMINLF